MSGKKIHLGEELEDNKTPLKNTTQTSPLADCLSDFILTRCKRLVVLETWDIFSKKALQDQGCVCTSGFKSQAELQQTLPTGGTTQGQKPLSDSGPDCIYWQRAALELASY